MTKAVARAKADNLAKRMGEDIGWEGRVWENLGWHYKAVLPFDGEGYAEIREYEGAFTVSYGAEIYLGYAGGAFEDGRDSLRAAFQFYGKGDCPKKALAQAIETMRRERTNLTTAFDRAEEGLVA